MAAVTICTDFGAQENKVSHCFHSGKFHIIILIYLSSLGNYKFYSFAQGYFLYEIVHMFLKYNA